MKVHGPLQRKCTQPPLMGLYTCRTLSKLLKLQIVSKTKSLRMCQNLWGYGRIIWVEYGLWGFSRTRVMTTFVVTLSSSSLSCIYFWYRSRFSEGFLEVSPTFAVSLVLLSLLHLASAHDDRRVCERDRNLLLSICLNSCDKDSESPHLQAERYAKRETLRVAKTSDENTKITK